jgi:hypothetical protein
MTELDKNAPSEEALARAFREAVKDRDAPIEGLFERVSGEVRRERGARAWLRSRPTGVRLALALGAVLVVGAVFTVIGRDHAPFGPIALLALIATLTVVVALRPIHRPALPRWVEISTLGLATGAPLALAGIAVFGDPTPVEGDLWYCFGLGVAIALPIVACVALLDRGSRAWSTVLAAAAAGLAANIALDAHCRSTEPVHLVLGHALVVILYVAVAGALVAIRRRGS